MKNHFFFPYAGNKRQEVEHIYENIDFKNIKTIVEAFCGSCALSYYIWTLNKEKNYKYILNDLDSHLIDFLKAIKNNKYKEIENEVNNKKEEIKQYEDDMIEAKKKYVEYLKSETLESWVFKQKYSGMRPGLFPLRDFNRYFNDKIFDFTTSPIYDFLTNADIELYKEDANKIIDKYDNKKTFIFLDPPYIASCNNFYSTDTGENINNIYEMLSSKGLKNFKCKILICHENNWLFKLIFKDYLYGEKEYKKKYENTVKGKQKQTTHIVVKNYKI
jgi:site-specific DNA-adenine methylase